LGQQAGLLLRKSRKVSGQDVQIVQVRIVLWRRWSRN